MVDRYAKFATGHLAAAAPRIERGRDRNVINSSRSGKAKGRALPQLFVLLVGRAGFEPATNGLKVLGTELTSETGNIPRLWN